MTERQYLLQHMLYLSAKLSEAASANERKNIEQALLFYARELQRVETDRKKTFLQ